MKMDLIKIHKGFNQDIPFIFYKNLWKLVRFRENKYLPIHRWFYFKEGFSANLLPYILGFLKLNEKDKLEVYDPFAGSGTILLSSQLYTTRNIKSFGTEINPFIYFIAKTKLEWHHMSPQKIKRYMNQVKQHIKYVSKSETWVPQLSTFQNPKYFPSRILAELSFIKSAIKDLEDSPEKEVLKLAFASIIEDSSFLKKDGRALKYIPHKKIKAPLKNLTERINMIIEDINVMKILLKNRSLNSTTIANADARRYLQKSELKEKFDLVIFSPPYPNKLDYPEVYKLEMWFLEFVKSYKEFKEIYKANAFYDSNPPPKIEYLDIGEYLSMLFPPEKAKEQKMLFGYLNNFYVLLENLYDSLKDNGYCVIVIGNPLFKINDKNLIVIPVDTIISLLSYEIGFNTHVILFTHKRPRGLKLTPDLQRLYRESVVILKK